MAVVAGLLAGCRIPVERPPAELTATRRIMGAPWKIVAHAADATAGEAAIAAAFAEIERLEKVLSDYDPASELSRLSAAAPTTEPVAVGDDLWRVLVRAESLREASGGAFDITVGPLTTLWRQSRRSGRLPRDDKLAAARAAVGKGTIELLADEQAVRLPKAGTRLDPGGIGMGYAADRAMEILTGRGITSALIDASGDILVSGPPPGRDGWRISIAPLRPGGEGEVVVLTHAAVTTSGDAFQAVEIDGTRYSHIVDPRTGLGLTGPAAVTVVAPDATTADSLATAASVLGPEAGGALIEAFPACSARFLWQDNGETRVKTTGRWPAAGVLARRGAPRYIRRLRRVVADDFVLMRIGAGEQRADRSGDVRLDSRHRCAGNLTGRGGVVLRVEARRREIFRSVKGEFPVASERAGSGRQPLEISLECLRESVAFGQKHAGHVMDPRRLDAR